MNDLFKNCMNQFIVLTINVPEKTNPKMLWNRKTIFTQIYVHLKLLEGKSFHLQIEINLLSEMVLYTLHNCFLLNY